MKLPILIAACVCMAGCHKQIATEKVAMPVKVASVDMYSPASSARYSASILPGRQVSLSFRVSGLVTAIHRIGNRGLEPGDMVPAGTILARLRPEDHRHSVAQADSQLEGARETHKSALAQLSQARASHAKAEVDFTRAKTLFESASLTKPEFDSARAQLDISAAQVEAARAQADGAAAQIRNAEAAVATARLAQSDASLVAPFTAALVERNIEVGMLAGPSVPAYSLADISTVKAAFGVPDTAVVKLRPGLPLSLHVEALPGRDLKGTVTAIAAAADAETRLFQVEVAIANGAMLLKPGMIASLSLTDAKPQTGVPVVPLAAVVRDRTSPSDFSVMVVEGSVARARRVALGPTYGNMLAITSGLKPGERVIRSGGSLVSDGDTVEVIQ
jgi:RND family efflux transporter MFP subunit